MEEPVLKRQNHEKTSGFQSKDKLNTYDLPLTTKINAYLKIVFLCKCQGFLKKNCESSTLEERCLQNRLACRCSKPE